MVGALAGAQTLEMTIDVVGKEPGSILSSITIENIPSEVTLAVGFAKGAAQRVRVVGCTCEKPGLYLTGKVRRPPGDVPYYATHRALHCCARHGISLAPNTHTHTRARARTSPLPTRRRASC